MIRPVWSLLLLLPLLSACVANQPKAVDDQTGQAGRASKPSDGRAEIYTNLAVSYLRENRLDIALQEGKKAIAADPDNANAQNVMGLIYQRLGQNALAEKHFKRAIAIDGHNFYALNAYGSFLCQLRRFDQALAQFDQAVKNPLNRSREVALANAGICAYGAGDKDKADIYLRSALSNNSRHAPALAQMAELNYDRGDYQAARDYLLRYEQVAQHNPKTLWAGVRIHQRLGQAKAQKAYADKLRKAFPDAIQVRMLRDLEKGS
ncbi:MAG: type IV pilus biogenesis/stability protein PilW [Gammaproteobacteria bacterium SHHR-1]|uniref:type IV pilus biogenesis/stability protein PilW n=1 Tax=Magnetovirga frankeli TaxID=947516 RepID=UPI0012936175|nr:type IV pilus biogenesis/stability protein PilW [gamma proteobacterium SS-5]